jgi:phosphatidylserine/phosphatidylglycerophosphate/cardiolipin synthase-like enzyme
MDHDQVTVLLGPSRKARDLKSVRVLRQVLLDTIASAQHRLVIVGYMLDSPEIVERITEKASRIRITVHLDRKQTRDNDGASLAAQKMEAAGAIVRFHDEDLYESLHAKVIIADDTEAIVGSANLTSRGSDRNYELGLLLKGPSVRILLDAVDKTLGAVED